uniref:Uncharacterized protein n=1 Tax=Globodera rostochiensis TaxID=31243 RepID=A0A914IHL8_GLORO
MTEKKNSSPTPPQQDPEQPIVQMPRDNPMPPEEELWIGLIQDGFNIREVFNEQKALEIEAWIESYIQRMANGN